MEVEPFFKKVSEAKANVTTKELFEELKLGNLEQAAQWIRLSGELQSALVLLCEGEPLQIVEQTQLEVADGKGFESLRKLQNNYDAQHEYLVPTIFRSIVDWCPEMGPKFGTQLEELEKTILRYHVIAGRSLDEGVALAALRNVAMQTEEILKDMKVNPSRYATYAEMKTRLMEYS